MKFFRIGVCALLVFGVLAHGGVEDWARAVFETSAGLLLVVWAIRCLATSSEQLVVPPLLPPLIAFALVVVVQILSRSTASVFLTRLDLLLLLSDIVVVFLSAQVFRTVDDWRSFLWFVMVFGFLVSAFGVLQHLAFNGKLYWFRQMRYGGIPFGPYVNRNHFAGFAELIIPFSLVPIVLGKVRRERLIVIGLFAVVPIVALFLSASRGGIISFVVELVLIALWVGLRGRLRTQSVVAIAVLLVAFAALSLLGVTQVLQRFSAMQSLETTEAKRAAMRLGTWHMFLDHPVLGTGLGTLQTVFPPYESLYDGKVVNHSHNDYLEALAETGSIGGLACAWFLIVLFAESRLRLFGQDQSLVSVFSLSAIVACMGFLTHELVDFNLHIPANALFFFLAAHLATSDISLPPPAAPAKRRRIRRRKP